MMSAKCKVNIFVLEWSILSSNVDVYISNLVTIGQNILLEKDITHYSVLLKMFFCKKKSIKKYKINILTFDIYFDL